MAFSNPEYYIFSMTDHVTMTDATRHLSELARRASRGDTIVLMDHGRPIAKLVAAEADGTARGSLEEALATFRAIRSRSKLGQDLSIATLIAEGRKY